LFSERKLVRGGVRIGAERTLLVAAFSVRSATYAEISRGPTSVLIHISADVCLCATHEHALDVRLITLITPIRAHNGGPPVLRPATALPSRPAVRRHRFGQGSLVMYVGDVTELTSDFARRPRSDRQTTLS